MKLHHFFLKNMVSKSCIRLIELYFKAYDQISIEHITLGAVGFRVEESSVITRKDLIKHIENLGFNVIENEDDVLVEQIKTAAIELIHLATNSNSLIRNSQYISERVQENYEKISKTFSKVTGITIEKYIIILKIEKVKMMLLDEDYTLSEISYHLGYSSVQYLSRQFKSTTGFTVSEFKELENPPRLPLENII